MDYAGRFNLLTRVLKEEDRRVRDREGDVTKEAEVKVIKHELGNGGSL